jgi:hypothetical protein
MAAMETIARLNAALTGRYTIERELGAGGMATVYLAQDLKHDRHVALKVLKPELAAVLGAERFVVEIKTTAALQHPNILPLFDSGTADSFLFYVMPWIEGETLRDKLNRETQLGVDEAVKIAREVADALDYAHRHGVIHRDIKPENILLHDGRPMVADFGIALALSAAAGGRMTETGLSLGTPHYMSPEQATAEKEISARSDVYSLGSVLYEMLTGNPPHVGSSAQQIIMKIITEPVEAVTKFRKSVPPNVAAAVAKSLEKLPSDRFESAKAFGDALGNAAYTNAAFTGAAAGGKGESARSFKRPFIAVSVLAAGGIAAAIFFATRSTPAPVPGRFAVELPDSVTVTGASSASVALSRDGSQLAIVCEKNGARALCVRRMDDPVAQVVRGTEGALYHSFSPDGRSLLFMVDRSLKKAPVVGGTPQTLADSATSLSSWGDGGNVVYELSGSLWLVSSDGGNRRFLAKPDPARGFGRYLQPEVLPGGRHALLAIATKGSSADSMRLGVISLRDGSVTDLGIRGGEPHYVAPGRLVFARANALVFSAPFSLRKRAVTGPPQLVLEHVRQGNNLISGFSVAQNGTIAYNTGAAGDLQAMYVVDRHGTERPLKGPMNLFREPRVSPDGKRIAVRIGSGQTDGGMWIHDIASGTLTRLTADSASVRGEWTRDGSHVVYVDHATSDSELVVSRPWDGSGAPKVLAKGGPYAFHALGIGPATGLTAIRRGNTSPDVILLAPTESLNAARPFITGSAMKLSPRVSPKGRLLAYSSDETGTQQIYVRQIPGPGPVVQVSVNGGTEPIWSADESALFYRGPTRLMVASVVERPALAVTRRDSLFVDTYRRYNAHPAYDVFPSGKEFLMTRGPASSGSQIYVIVNWMQLVGKQAGTGAEP